MKVGSFLETLMGADNFERVKETFPLATLDGLMNASHFVSISRIEESLKNEAQSLANANDFVSDKHRNVITMDRLRLALARQCGLIMPPNYYGIDAIIPVCLATEEVIDPKGNVTIKDVGREGRENDIPYDLYDPNNENESKKNRYRPIYSFLAIQYKSGRFDLDAIPKMQARLHIVPCANFSEKDKEGNHLKCPSCASELALKEIFDNQISLLYCFLKKEKDSKVCLKKQYTVNYGPELGNSNSSPATLFEKKDFCKILYPNIREIEAYSVFIESNETVNQSTSVRTFEDFLLRHRIKLNESIELINIYSDENQGCTFRASDIQKWEKDERNRLSLESKAKKRKIDKESVESELIAAGIESMNTNDAVAAADTAMDTNYTAAATDTTDTSATSASADIAMDTNSTTMYTNDASVSVDTAMDTNDTIAAADSAMDTNDTTAAASSSIQTKFPDPIRPLAPFNQSRMNTVIIYGWKPWENVIGPEGILMAEKLFNEFVQDPLKNVKAKDIKLLLPSLKIIMSSKLLGLDRYLESKDGQDDISYNQWLYLIFEKFRDLSAPDESIIYQSAKKSLENEKSIG